MEVTKKTARLDRIGMTASIACAIHCAAVPLLITALPLLGLGFLANPWFEWGMIGLALVIGVTSIGSSYFKVHRKFLPIFLLLLGFFLIAAGHMVIKNWLEAVIVPLGGLTVATAHLINYRYAGACAREASIFHLKHTHHRNAS